MITPDELNAMKSRVAKATEGPWWTSEMSIGLQHGRAWEVSTEEGHGIWTAHTQTPADAEFIVHSRTDLPRLLAYIDFLKEELERCR